MDGMSRSTPEAGTVFHGGVCRGDSKGGGVSARARRASCAGGRVCHRVPLRVRMGQRRLPRRRHVLRPLRLPDHEPPPRGVPPREPHRPRQLLGAPGAPAPSRTLLGARGCRRICDVVDAGGVAGCDPGRRAGGALLLGQLAVHLRAQLVLQPVRFTVDARAHVVARDRRAVLPAVATDRRGVPCSRPRATRSPRGPRHRDCHHLGTAHGAPGKRRSEPGVLRHGHAGALTPRRCVARARPRTPAHRPHRSRGTDPPRHRALWRSSAVVAAYVTIGDGRLFMYRGGFLVFALVGRRSSSPPQCNLAGRCERFSHSRHSCGSARSRTASTCGTGRCSSSSHRIAPTWTASRSTSLAWR